MIKVIYVGNDHGYFEELKKRFLQVKKEMEFKILWTDDLDRFHRLSFEILNDLPNIAFLDYSAHPQKVMTLARLLPRIFERGPNIIGLWNAQAKKEWVMESFALGIPFTHFKSPEFSDLIDQAFFLYHDNQFPERAFAKAEMVKKPVLLRGESVFRVGFLNSKTLHVEHDFLPPEKKTFELIHHLQDFPIHRFKSQRRIDRDYYYEKAYVSEYSFVIFDENERVKAEDFREQGGLVYKKAQYNEQAQLEQRERVLKKVDQFISKKKERSYPKRTRILVIDQDMDILKQAPKPLDEYPYSIRFFRSMSLRPDIINRVWPGLIFFQISKNGEGRDEIRQLVEEAKKEGSLIPFIFVFRAKKESKALQEEFDYHQLFGIEEDFQMDKMLELADLYHQRSGREKSHKDKEADSERLYLKKDSLESFLRYQFDIKLLSLCETWISFSSEEEFVIWSQIHIANPVPFVITVIECEQKTGEKEKFYYRGVIHGMGEKERASLRRSINQLIYDEAHTEESEESKKSPKK